MAKREPSRFAHAEKLGKNIRAGWESLKGDPLGRSIFRAVLCDSLREAEDRVDGPHPVDRETPEGMGDMT